jgi:hypothetical protein
LNFSKSIDVKPILMVSEVTPRKESVRRIGASVVVVVVSGGSSTTVVVVAVGSSAGVVVVVVGAAVAVVGAAVAVGAVLVVVGAVVVVGTSVTVGVGEPSDVGDPPPQPPASSARASPSPMNRLMDPSTSGSSLRVHRGYGHRSRQ